MSHEIVAHPERQRDALLALYEEVGFARSLLAYELPDGRLKLLDGHLRRDLDPDMEVDVRMPHRKPMLGMPSPSVAGRTQWPPWRNSWILMGDGGLFHRGRTRTEAKLSNEEWRWFMTPKDFESIFARIAAMTWLMGTVTQGNRVLENLGSTLAVIGRLSGETDCMTRQKEISELQATRQVDEHFFLIAAMKAYDWIKLAKDGGKGPVTDMEAFLGVLAPHTADIRNMREHDDEYIRGKGRNQDRYETPVESSFPNKYRSDGLCEASTTIVNSDKEYLLGGRVCLRRVTAAAATLLVKLKDFE